MLEKVKNGLLILKVVKELSALKISSKECNMSDKLEVQFLLTVYKSTMKGRIVTRVYQGYDHQNQLIQI